MKKQPHIKKQAVHITAQYLLNPTNPLLVNLIGAGGTGSQMMTALGRINHSLIALGHPGLMVQVFDDDLVTEANQGRQLFYDDEIGMNKAIALVNRYNGFFGTNWKAIPEKFCRETALTASVHISCVDNVATRFEIAKLLKQGTTRSYNRDKSLYWLDFGNSKETGQVILSTVGKIKQPSSKLYKTVSTLPFVTKEYKELLIASERQDNTPSCSLAEALESQDLFINSSLANLGGSLFWELFREGMVSYRGFFLNLKHFRTQPIPVA